MGGWGERRRGIKLTFAGKKRRVAMGLDCRIHKALMKNGGDHCFEKQLSRVDESERLISSWFFLYIIVSCQWRLESEKAEGLWPPNRILHPIYFSEWSLLECTKLNESNEILLFPENCEILKNESCSIIMPIDSCEYSMTKMGILARLKWWKPSESVNPHWNCEKSEFRDLESGWQSVKCVDRVFYWLQ